MYILDELQKKWYDRIMENISEINKKIAKNLAYYRKAAGLTQAELAEKINYSDKSVSKWEQGNGVPDIYILMKLAALYRITLNELVGEDVPEQSQHAKKTKGLKILIMLLSSGIVWLVATCFFVALRLIAPQGQSWWLAFIYAIVANAIVLIVYACIWKYRLINFLSISTLIWTSITCLYLTILAISGGAGTRLTGLWCIYLVGIPLQVLEVLWAFFRTLFRKNKNKVMVTDTLPVSEE